MLINNDFGRARGKCRWRQALGKIVIWRCLTPHPLFDLTCSNSSCTTGRRCTLSPHLTPCSSFFTWFLPRKVLESNANQSRKQWQAQREWEGPGGEGERERELEPRWVAPGDCWLDARVQSIWKISSVIHIQDAQRCSRTIKRWQRNESKWAEALKGGAGWWPEGGGGKCRKRKLARTRLEGRVSVSPQSNGNYGWT